MSGKPDKMLASAIAPSGSDANPPIELTRAHVWCPDYEAEPHAPNWLRDPYFTSAVDGRALPSLIAERYVATMPDIRPHRHFWRRVFVRDGATRRVYSFSIRTQHVWVFQATPNDAQPYEPPGLTTRNT